MALTEDQDQKEPTVDSPMDTVVRMATFGGVMGMVGNAMPAVIDGINNVQDKFRDFLQGADEDGGIARFENGGDLAEGLAAKLGVTQMPEFTNAPAPVQGPVPGAAPGMAASRDFYAAPTPSGPKL